MLILIGILPGLYALDLNVDTATLHKLTDSSQAAMVYLDKHASASNPLTGIAANEQLSAFLRSGKPDAQTFAALAGKNREVAGKLIGKSDFKAVSKEERRALRSDIYLVSKTIDKLDKKETFKDAAEKKTLVDYKKQLVKVTEFIPDWVKFAVALALGFGTMIGWKRIVVTVGEKIGKEHMTYAQGGAAELVAMTTIFAADQLGLPVSTTHVLSSGVAGAMTANGSGIQKDTVRSLIIAWVLTLPVCIFLGALTFSFGLFLVLNVFGLK
jgi:PiT family inorganic phosphate transporter